jgi:outer membrane protein assembly factor BamB
MRLNSPKTVLFAAMTLLAAILILGCSHGGSPVEPGIPTGLSAPAPGQASAVTSRMLWGLWDVNINPDTGQAEIIPLRGVMFNANVVRFLQPPLAPVNLVMIQVNPGTDFLNGYVDLDVTLQHPFPGLNQFRGFDVRGTVMGDGDVPFGFDPTVFRSGANGMQLLNPDGWTRWWNPTEFTTYDTILGYSQGAKAPSYHVSATVNPYKYFADNLEPDEALADLDLAERGSFTPADSVNTRRYIIQFPVNPGGPDFHFNYAIDASWTAPDFMYAPDFPVEAFPPEANTPEAWNCSIYTGDTTAWYVNDIAKGGSIKMSLEIYDWQGPYNMSGVPGEVGAIYAESPLFWDSPDLLPLATIKSGGPVSSVYNVEITDFNNMSSGTFPVWIAVQADDPANYAPQIDGDPYNFAWPDAPLRAYFQGYIDVSGVFPSDAPIIETVIPNQGEQSTVVSDLQIIGQNFQVGATVEFRFDASTTLNITDVQTVDPNLITCDVDCAGPLGFYDITVVNPDTQQDTADDIFEVIEVEEEIWWKSVMYNNRNIGTNPTVPGADPETLTQVWSSPAPGSKKYCTPVVADNKIFFTSNDTFWANASMTVFCYDLITGEQLWYHPIFLSDPTDNRAFGGPVWWRDDDGIGRVAVGGEQVFCYYADTGEEIWTFDATYLGTNMDWVSNQLQEYNGLVLARARWAVLYVLDFMTGDMVQEIDCSSGSEGGCGAKDDLVYISSNYYIDCANIYTGEMVWSTLLPNGAQITHWVNPTLANDRCYFSTYQGYVFCVATINEGSYVPGDIIWSWNDPTIPAGNNPFVGGTAVIGDRIFVAPAFSGNYIYCIQDMGDTGQLLWKSDTTGYFDASPVWSTAPSYPDGVVYCPDRNGYIRAWNASDGHEIWALYTGGELRAGITPILDYLVVTSGTDVTVFQD